MWEIIINGPGYVDTAYKLPEGVTHLGRADDNDIILDGTLVSRRHARLLVRGDSLRVEDLGSRNGSRLNGLPFEGCVELRPGDTLFLGENTLAVRQLQPQEGRRQTDRVLLGVGGVCRFRAEGDVAPLVILAKEVKDADVLRALDNAGSSALATHPPLEVSAPRVSYETLVLLFHTAEALATASSLRTFLEVTMDRVLERIEAMTAVVLLRNGSGALVPAAVRHRGPLAQGEVPVSDAIIEEALRQGSALAVGDVRLDRRFADRQSVLLYSVDRVLCIPIGAAQPFDGVLYVNTSAGGDITLEVMLDACTAVAHLVSTGVQKFLSREEWSEQRLRPLFERFHPPAVAERLASEVQLAGGRRPGLEERVLTVLQVELVGAGTLLGQLGAERATAILEEFHTRMAELVFGFEGSVESFLGETMRAHFGASRPREDDAVRAVRAALALRSDWVRAMSRRPLDERCDLRIGLHTTQALVGLVGREPRIALGVAGPGVNVAGWLAAMALPGQVLITDRTLAAVGSCFDVVCLGERLVPAPKERVTAFEVLSEGTPPPTRAGEG